MNTQKDPSQAMSEIKAPKGVPTYRWVEIKERVERGDQTQKQQGEWTDVPKEYWGDLVVIPETFRRPLPASAPVGSEGK